MNNRSNDRYLTPLPSVQDVRINDPPKEIGTHKIYEYPGGHRDVQHSLNQLPVHQLQNEEISPRSHRTGVTHNQQKIPEKLARHKSNARW